MGWKGTLHSIEAAQRRAERDARRRQRDLEQQCKHLEQMQELERAAYEVQVYENYIDVLLSIHKECGEVWDWEAVHLAKPPVEPVKSHIREEAAKAELDKYKPSLTDKLLKRANSKREELLRSVEEAQQTDEEEYQQALITYEQEYTDWQAIRALAERILANDHKAFITATTQINLFSELEQLGSAIEFHADDSHLVEATLHVNSEDVVPQEIKSLLKSGKLSVKKMPKTRFYELYQDYVCGAALRVARELFALLPIEMVIVTAVGMLLNSRTGYMEEQPILSVAIPKRTLKDLNFAMLDPSDAMENFVHQMKFRKTKGFAIVNRISPSNI